MAAKEVAPLTSAPPIVAATAATVGDTVGVALQHLSTSRRGRRHSSSSSRGEGVKPTLVRRILARATLLMHEVVMMMMLMMMIYDESSLFSVPANE